MPQHLLQLRPQHLPSGPWLPRDVLLLPATVPFPRGSEREPSGHGVAVYSPQRLQTSAEPPTPQLSTRGRFCPALSRSLLRPVHCWLLFQENHASPIFPSPAPRTLSAPLAVQSAYAVRSKKNHKAARLGISSKSAVLYTPQTNDGRLKHTVSAGPVRPDLFTFFARSPRDRQVPFGEQLPGVGHAACVDGYQKVTGSFGDSNSRSRTFTRLARTNCANPGNF